jgi:glycosyltransferase involved in cell wall biosynthesis
MPDGEKGLPRLSESADRSPPVIYDVTRLVTRGLVPSPNGIDRVDFALARHFLRKGGAALACTAIGPRLAEPEKAIETLAEIEAYWREDGGADRDGVYLDVVSALSAAGGERGRSRIQRRFGGDRALRNWRALRDWAFRLGRPATQAPQGAVYFSATQFLLDRAWYVRWLDARPDVKAVSFVHDLLPVDAPEFFRPVEAAAHPRRNRNICRFASGVVAGSQSVARRYAAYAAEQGRADLPICVPRLPVSPAFEAPAEPPEELRDVPYFIACGTIEPRKNHMLLLNLWRELANESAPPRLVIVGKRGWLNENVVDQMTRSPSLRPLVIEAGGMTTPGLRRLMAGARALLAPSHAEGFGLPVAEALIAGVPVIASDIDAFREVGGAAPDYVRPLDGLGWLQAVRDYAAPVSPRRDAAIERMRRTPLKNDAEGFVRTIEEFFAAL